ncbi:hypothetical protein HNQ56_001132 [Anaerotaenia torta]|uniref:hypothetical protein n=1 Tax=Anaerotaenia torta TaxID=433293 RepID=UPI003D231614
MSDRFFSSGRSGFQYGKPTAPSKGNNDNRNTSHYTGEDTDADLIIEDNTIYEIDRACFERLKQKKRRE